MSDAMNLLSIEEAATRLRLSVPTLRLWRRTGEGPVSFQLGRSLFYSGEEVDSWVRAQYDAAVAARSGARS